MATTDVKRKKFSLTTLFSVILAILPVILSILNDPNDSDTVSIGLKANPGNGSVKATVFKSDKGGNPVQVKT